MDAEKAIYKALEYWQTHAKNDFQRGIIYGLQLAIENIKASTLKTK